MRAYILRTDRLITPFNRPARDCRIHNRSLAETQQFAIRRCGLDFTPINSINEINEFPCVLVRDDVFFTKYALSGFLKTVRRELAGKTNQSKAERNFQAVLDESILTERFVKNLQGARAEREDGTACRSFDLYYLSQLDRSLDIAAQSQLLSIPHRVVKMSTRVNRTFEPTGRFVVPVSRVFITPVHHWSNILLANLLGTPARLLETAKQQLLSTVALPLVCVLRAGSLRPLKLVGKTYWRKSRSRIHPTAHVEGCIVGRNVKIAPHAVVKNSVLGDRSMIGPGAVVEGCTLGREASVEAHSVVRCSVLSDGASVGAMLLQMSVVGVNAVVCPMSGASDFALRGNAHTKLDGELVNTGSPFLGVAFGDESFIAPFVPIVGGQEIPNGCYLVPGPRTVVRDASQSLPDNIARIDAGRRQLRSNRQKQKRAA